MLDLIVQKLYNAGSECLKDWHRVESEDKGVRAAVP